MPGNTRLKTPSVKVNVIFNTFYEILKILTPFIPGFLGLKKLVSVVLHHLSELILICLQFWELFHMAHEKLPEQEMIVI